MGRIGIRGLRKVADSINGVSTRGAIEHFNTEDARFSFREMLEKRGGFKSPRSRIACCSAAKVADGALRLGPEATNPDMERHGSNPLVTDGSFLRSIK